MHGIPTAQRTSRRLVATRREDRGARGVERAKHARRADVEFAAERRAVGRTHEVVVGHEATAGQCSTLKQTTAKHEAREAISFFISRFLVLPPV